MAYAHFGAEKMSRIGVMPVASAVVTSASSSLHEYPLEVGSEGSKPAGRSAGATLLQLNIRRTYVAPASCAIENALLLPTKLYGSKSDVLSGRVEPVV